MSNTTTTWRTTARAVLNRIVQQAADQQWTRQQFDTAVFDRYPFGVREFHPYRVWCEERHHAIQAFVRNTTRDTSLMIEDIVALDALRTGQRVSPAPVPQEQLSFF